ncbi:MULTISPECIES: hypothetical protein [unclassified Frankia]|uniref:hypothetical protein n=1 Tax=unclassified Frankia TaxID=2632575 RepID=UPI001EF5BAF2|nr:MULTISPECIES: hypothetical protein [unclassified Frankia]
MSICHPGDEATAVREKFVAVYNFTIGGAAEGFLIKSVFDQILVIGPGGAGRVDMIIMVFR